MSDIEVRADRHEELAALLASEEYNLDPEDDFEDWDDEEDFFLDDEDDFPMGLEYPDDFYDEFYN